MTLSTERRKVVMQQKSIRNREVDKRRLKSQYYLSLTDDLTCHHYPSFQQLNAMLCG